MKAFFAVGFTALLVFAVSAMASDCGSVVVSSAPPAGGTWSSPCRPDGSFNVSVRGTFVATFTLQRSTDGTNWYDVDTYTDEIEGDQFYDPEHVALYRIGVKNAGFTSGSGTGRLGK